MGLNLQGGNLLSSQGTDCYLNRMKHLFLSLITGLCSFFLLGLIPFFVLGQQPQYLNIGVVDSVRSDILGETRELWIYTPNKAQTNPELRFPVLYLLDGDTYFHALTGVVSHLSELNGNAIIPDMIVVGIINTDRNRDFTPTEDVDSRLPNTGGGKAFTNFLARELIPHIEANYPTAPYRGLLGHSLGGLIAVNIMLDQPELFDAYLAIDPSLWWDDMVLLEDAPKLLKQRSLKNKRLFVGIANSLPPHMDTTQGLADTTFASVGYRSVVRFRDILNESSTVLTWGCKYYPNEGHGSVPMMSTYDGLRFIFDYYKRPSFVVIPDDADEIMEDHYRNVSEKLGYSIPPPARPLAGLAWRCRVFEQRNELARKLLELGDKYHPESVDILYQWGDYYKEMGEEEKANEYYLKGMELEKKAGE